MASGECGGLGARGPPGIFAAGEARGSRKAKRLNDLRHRGVLCGSGGDLLSHFVSEAVSSALRSLTTEFGMGSGGTSSLKPPENGLTGLESNLLVVIVRRCG